MTERLVELRSDTFTRPTDEMRRAMFEAEVGDDVWGEDPTVSRLEARAAELTGKESAVFTASGTQGNLVALLSHARPGNEVILGTRAHIFTMEGGAAAIVGGIQLHPVEENSDGGLDSAAVRAALHGREDEHVPPTGAVALENTHNRAGGTVLSPEDTAGVARVAHDAGVPVHLDGARLFNAAVALGVPARRLTESVDSVMFSLSKGLGAPVGSVLCGSSDYVARARRWRKILGGGMRQAGVLAAAALVGLQDVDRLAEDHRTARILAEGLADIPGIDVELDRVQTNIVMFDIASTGLTAESLMVQAGEQGVRLFGAGTDFRAVTSYEVNFEDIERALDVINGIVRPAVLAGA